ncbi:ATP binding cassette-like protein [Rhodococcus phage NiceHouse]|nr:ATP binding cassette-like protein [Rhodococcus phage NiceHouse]
MLANTKDIKTSGSLGGRVINYGLDVKSLVHLMGVLTELYSFPDAAVIREYTTNALDSHIAAGQTRPVELSTPSRLSPYFVVQDFGVGMSENDIEEIYSQFGGSTKRDNNDEAGMLGLGSKSALTYTEQFNMITIKDGVKLLVSISRDATGAGSLEIVDTSLTDEPNGVTIKIPVQKDISEFSAKVYDFGRFVKAGSLLINGAAPPSDLEYVTENIAVVPKDNYQNDRIVMGNVSYPTSTRLLDTHQVIYYVPMGAVDFTPSREELMDTSITRNTLDKMKKDFNLYFEGHLDKMIQSQENLVDAWKLQMKYRNDYRNRNLHFTYRGVTLPLSLSASFARWHSNIDDGKLGYGELYYNDLDENVVIVTDWTNSKFTRVQARKLKAYMESIGRPNQYRAILQENKPFPELYRNNHTVSWTEVKKIGVQKNKPKVARVAKSWEGYGPDNKTYLKWFVPDDKLEIYYASKSLLDGRTTWKSVVSDKSQFFYVTNSEEERFKKLYPKAKFLGEYFEKIVVDYLAKLNKQDFEFYEYYRSGGRNDYLLDWTKIDDPELKNVVRYSSGTLDEAVARYEAAMEAYSVLSYAAKQKFKFPEFTPKDKKAYIYERYALLEHCHFYTDRRTRHGIVADLHEYVNAKYAADKERAKKADNDKV